MTPTQRSATWSDWLLPALAWTVGVLGAVAVWLSLVLATRAPCGWMAPVAALDLVLMLRLAAAPAGASRAGLAILGTLIATAAGYWLFAASVIGRPLGLLPLTSAGRLGPVLAGDLVAHASSAWDLAYLALALLLAWRLGR